MPPTFGPNGSIHPTHCEPLVHHYVNEQRSEHGLGQLEYDSNIASIARMHSEDMAEQDFFSHTSPSGDGPKQRYDQSYNATRAVRSIGENIAQRTTSYSVEADRESLCLELSKSITEQWMNSRGHRENLLSDKWSHEGIGVHFTGQRDQSVTLFVTQLFVLWRN